MKVTVLQENLSKALSTAARAVDARPMMPVLANVLLETEDSRLRISATNTELTITTWIGAQVREPGRITLPARTFAELVNNLSPEKVVMELDPSKQEVHVTCGANDSHIKGIDADEFPNIPSGGQADIVMSGKILKEMIKHTEFAAAKEENRPILTGIYTLIQDNVLTMAAADGYRLAVRNATLEEHFEEQIELVIPARNLAEVARIVDEDEEVAITLPTERDLIMFQTKHTEITSQLLEGRFPDFRAIMPRSYSTATTIETTDLLRAAKRAEIFARDNAYSARITVTPPRSPSEPGYLAVVGRSAERGDNEGQLVASIEGEPLEISFNIRYLIDVLNVITEPRVIIESNGTAAPGVVRPEGRDDFVHVIMPMSTNR